MVAAFLHRLCVKPGPFIGLEIPFIYGKAQPQSGGMDARPSFQHLPHRRGHALQALYTEIMLEFRNDVVLVVGEPHLAERVECGSDVPGVPDLPARRLDTRLAQAFRQKRTREPARYGLELQQQPVRFRQLHVPLPQGFEWIHGSSLGGGEDISPSSHPLNFSTLSNPCSLLLL